MADSVTTPLHPNVFSTFDNEPKVQEALEPMLQIQEPMQLGLVVLSTLALMLAFWKTSQAEDLVTTVPIPLITLLLVALYPFIVTKVIVPVGESLAETINPHGRNILTKYYDEYLTALQKNEPEESGGDDTFFGGVMDAVKKTKGALGSMFSIRRQFFEGVGIMAIMIQLLMQLFAYFGHKMMIVFSPMILGLISFQNTRGIAMNFIRVHIQLLMWPVAWAIFTVILSVLMNLFEMKTLTGQVIMGGTFATFWLVGIVIAPWLVAKALIAGENVASSALKTTAGKVTGMMMTGAAVAGGPAIAGALTGGGKGGSSPSVSEPTVPSPGSASSHAPAMPPVLNPPGQGNAPAPSDSSGNSQSGPPSAITLSPSGHTESSHSESGGQGSSPPPLLNVDHDSSESHSSSETSVGTTYPLPPAPHPTMQTPAHLQGLPAPPPPRYKTVNNPEMPRGPSRS